MIHKPAKNRFVPEQTKTLVSQEAQEKRNAKPKEIALTEDGRMHLFHSLDHVYLKPWTFLDIMLRIRQPKKRYNEHGKPTCFLETPKDFALFNVMRNCLEGTVTK